MFNNIRRRRSESILKYLMSHVFISLMSLYIISFCLPLIGLRAVRFDFLASLCLLQHDISVYCICMFIRVSIRGFVYVYAFKYITGFILILFKSHYLQRFLCIKKTDNTIGFQRFTMKKWYNGIEMVASHNLFVAFTIFYNYPWRM